MEQSFLRKKLRKKGAIVAFILWLCVALLDFGPVIAGNQKEFTGVVSFIALFITVFFYLVYFIVAVPVIVRIREFKPEQEQSQTTWNTSQKDAAEVNQRIKKRGFWMGFFLGLIPLSVSIFWSFWQLLEQLRNRDIYGKWHFIDDIYLPLIYGLVFAVVLTLAGLMIGWVIGKIKSRN